MLCFDGFCTASAANTPIASARRPTKRRPHQSISSECASEDDWLIVLSVLGGLYFLVFYCSLASGPQTELANLVFKHFGGGVWGIAGIPVRGFALNQPVHPLF